MPLQGDRKKAYQKIYMKPYMREYRKKKPPIPATVTKAIGEYIEEIDLTAQELWTYSHRPDVLLYPDCEWTDDMLEELK